MLSPPSEMKICSYLQKSSEKQKLNFSRSAPFHMKARVCLKYFGMIVSGNIFLLDNTCKSKAFDTILTLNLSKKFAKKGLKLFLLVSTFPLFSLRSKFGIESLSVVV